MSKCVIGLDFGTLSGRAVVSRVSDGKILASASADYEKGVIEGTLPDGTALPKDFALADIGDYVTVMFRTIRKAVKESGISPEDLIGIGLDVTSSTFLPLGEGNTALYRLPEYRKDPHAWMKLWKHHGAQREADLITEKMLSEAPALAERTGGKVNAEWMLPKLLELYLHAPLIYEKTENFMEAGDYLVYVLTGEVTRSAGPTGYKLLQSTEDDAPTDSFLESLAPGFSGVKEKLRGRSLPLGAEAGRLQPEIAELLGLPAGLPVAAMNIDAHVSFPSAGLTEEGQLLLILGTSCCCILQSREKKPVSGIFGIVKDGVEPGFYGYEAGQSAVGDMYDWLIRNGVPKEYRDEAEEKGRSLHELLTEKAMKLRPGESGLLMLDWLNGNRSVLSDTRLTGLLTGLTIRTKPEEIYRACLEATAFGLREIIDHFEESGVPVREIYACGGISRKNPILLQIISDVTGRSLRISASTESPALGSAMFGAVCAGKARGGFDSIFEAAKTMGRLEEKVYAPIPAHKETYALLFREYHRLHEYFGRGGSDLMKALLMISEGRD